MAAHVAMEPSLFRHKFQLDDVGVELNKLGLLACPTELDGGEEAAPPQETENLDHQVLGRLLRAEPITEVSQDRLQARGSAAGPGSPPGIVATNPVGNLSRVDVRERVPRSVRGISLRLGDAAFPLGLPEEFRAGWVSRVVSEHVAGESGPHAELVEEHQEDVLQALGRDAEPFRQVPTLGSHVFVEAMVSNPRQAKVQERGTIPGCDSDLIEKRCFLPGLNSLQGLVRNPIRMLRNVRIVAVSDSL